MSQDRPALGVTLMLGFCLVAPLGDAMAKLLGEAVPLGQVLLFRFAFQAAVLIPLVAWSGRMWRMTGRVLRLTILRTFLHIGGIAAMFTALKYLPLADAVAIAFVMPFILLLLGKFVLSEEVGARRIVACVIGFIGTLMVIQPSFASVGWPALLPLLVAITFSFFILTTRQIAKETDPIGLQAVSGVMATAMIAPVVVIGTWFEVPVLAAITPSATDWWMLIGIGFFGTAAHLLMTWSLRYAPSASLAPMQYLEIPVATVIGLMVFSEFPNALALAGICVTVVAGLYVVFREGQLAAKKPDSSGADKNTQSSSNTMINPETKARRLKLSQEAA